MGCCQKRKEKEQLIEKNDQEKEEGDQTFNDDNIKITYTDFQPLKLLGTGSFGRVLLVRFLKNNKLYAMKILSKTQIKLKRQQEHTKTERDLMVKVNCPFVVNIKFAFQDESKLYIVSDFMQGGDMFFHLHSQKKKVSEKTAKFYIIELILGLEFLHKNNVIYRDLKPENILMDTDGHLKISDFGLSKILEYPEEKAYTLCGTPQYIAPEIIKNKGYDKSIDWWALGCFLYEMLTGCLPFRIPKGNRIDPKIYEERLRFPPNTNQTAINLVNQLLNPNPKKRLGFGESDAKKIKQHPFFKDIDWEKYWKKEIQPPFIPQLDSELDLKYFDKMFTDELITSNRPTIVRESRLTEYKNFTYITKSVSNEMMQFSPGNDDVQEEHSPEEDV